MKTLYVSDLDGTLMRRDGTISLFTVRTVNELIRQGLYFTYATARSIKSARTIAGDLQLTLPVITRNGAVLADNRSGNILDKAVFPDHEVSLLKKMLPELPVYGFVSCFFGDRMVKSYFPGKHSAEFQGYLDYCFSRNDPDMIPAEDTEGLFCGQSGYVTLIGEFRKLASIFE